GPADAFHRRANGLGARGRLVAGEAVRISEGSGSARDGRGLGASMGLCGQERGDDGGRGRSGSAPRAVHQPVNRRQSLR
ncbi:MAG: hypothetical protein WB902_30315, partial [Acetobacteraceae bacterium]